MNYCIKHRVESHFVSVVHIFRPVIHISDHEFSHIVGFLTAFEFHTRSLLGNGGKDSQNFISCFGLEYGCLPIFEVHTWNSVRVPSLLHCVDVFDQSSVISVTSFSEPLMV